MRSGGRRLTTKTTGLYRSLGEGYGAGGDDREGRPKGHRTTVYRYNAHQRGYVLVLLFTRYPYFCFSAFMCFVKHVFG